MASFHFLKLETLFLRDKLLATQPTTQLSTNSQRRYRSEVQSPQTLVGQLMSTLTSTIVSSQTTTRIEHQSTMGGGEIVLWAILIAVFALPACFLCIGVVRTIHRKCFMPSPDNGLELRSLDDGQVLCWKCLGCYRVEAFRCFGCYDAEANLARRAEPEASVNFPMPLSMLEERSEIVSRPAMDEGSRPALYAGQRGLTTILP